MMMLEILVEFQPIAASQSDTSFECHNPKKTSNITYSSFLSLRDRIGHCEYIWILSAASNRKSM